MALLTMIKSIPTEVQRIKIDLCILCKESIRKSSEGRNWRRVSLKIVNSAAINVEVCP